jgi:hypothetical protein
VGQQRPELGAGRSLAPKAVAVNGYHDDDGQEDGDDQEVGAAAMARLPGGWAGGIEPWHMWGTTQNVTTEIGLAATTVESNQVARVAYRRPETFNWIFAARLISGQNTSPFQTTVRVHFDLIVGVGRTMINIPNFETLEWSWVAGLATPTDIHLFTTTAVGHRSALRTNLATTTVDTVIDEITAQDIQLSCRVVSLVTGGLVVDPYVVEVSGHFAPKTHMRPDWFLPGPKGSKFPGAEVGGR